LAKRLRRAEADKEKLEAKLANADFAKNAPAEVVAKDRARVAELRAEIDQLAKQIDRVNRLLGP
jgi:valyl-tRNA synthetase